MEELGVLGKSEFVPSLFQGEAEAVARMFEGGILPKRGDVIETVCYQATEASGIVSLKCRFRVKGAE